PEARTAELAAPAPLAEEPAPPKSAREELALAAPVPEAPPAAARSAVVSVEGRCVDERLVPIGGACVRQAAGDAPQRTESLADGQFALAVRPSTLRTCTLALEAPGFATRVLELSLPAADAMLLGDVVLAPGGSV